MLVDVVQLRLKGEKRPRAEVRAETPIRAVLTLDYVRPGWHRRQRDPPLLAGLVAPGAAKWALPPLDHARIECIRGPNLYIVGIEEIIKYRDQVTEYRQAWWCRLVLDTTSNQAAKTANLAPAPSARLVTS